MRKSFIFFTFILYLDWTKATVDQIAKDIVNFLQWIAESEIEESKPLRIKSNDVFCYLYIDILHRNEKSMETH